MQQRHMAMWQIYRYPLSGPWYATPAIVRHFFLLCLIFFLKISKFYQATKLIFVFKLMWRFSSCFPFCCCFDAVTGAEGKCFAPFVQLSAFLVFLPIFFRFLPKYFDAVKPARKEDVFAPSVKVATADDAALLCQHSLWWMSLHLNKYTSEESHKDIALL